ncbi:hypothetical protein NW762_010252 [Fusarium torreyae]|uniref:Uncharacterized protein n=1 Tax=Fusarium torreyae TaxID=1237075 RepID=A0A9W8VAG6_9HYPO|nr:hypothetical protein NW762_010252 [Fusarium torreyae]
MKSLSLTTWSLFEDDVDFVTLRQMISQASALTAFTYTAGRGRRWGSLSMTASSSREDVSPHSLVNKLRFQKSTLRKLHLNFVHEAYTFTAESPSVFVSSAQLHEFAHLENLTLDVSSYCRHIFDREDIGPGWDESTCLTELLPSTICDLTIFIHDIEQEEYWLDLIHLGKHVVSGRHLGLRRLQINAMLVVRDAISASQDQEYEETREERTRKILAAKEPDVRRAFRSSRVQVVFKLPADFGQ